eukprot:4192827-Pleurochrysis_carterae.AAC.1
MAGAEYLREPVAELAADELGTAAAEVFRTRRHDVALDTLEPAGVSRGQDLRRLLSGERSAVELLRARLRSALACYPLCRRVLTDGAGGLRGEAR